MKPDNLKKFVMRLNIEISTRKVGSKNFTSANIAEYLNTLFPLIENLRVILRDNCESISLDYASKCVYLETVDLIQLLLEFEDTWNFSYNTWINAYKNKKTNIMFFDRLYEKRFLDTQEEFSNYTEITNDINLINLTIDHYLETINGIGYNHVSSNNFFSKSKVIPHATVYTSSTESYFFYTVRKAKETESSRYSR